MRFFFSSMLAELRSSFRKLPSLLLAAALPLIALISVMLLPPSEGSALIEVGVTVPGDCTEFEALVEARNSELVHFCFCSEEEINKNVALGYWDCGFVLAPDFSDRIKELDTDKIVSIVVGPNSQCYAAVRESIAACILEAEGPYIAENYIVGAGIADEDTAVSVFESLCRELDESERVLVKMEDASAGELTVSALKRSVNMRLFTAFALLVLPLWLVVLAFDLRSTLHSDHCIRMRQQRSAFEIAAPLAAAGLIPVAVSLAVSLLILRLF